MGVTVGSLLQGGFRLIRERPGAMLIWTLVQLAAAIAVSFAMAAVFQAGQDPQLAGASAESAAAGQALWAGLLSVAQIAVGTVLSVAAQRAILYPAEGGPGWLKLGMDEVRQFLLIVLYILIFGLSLVIVAVVLGQFFAGGSEAGLQAFAILIIAICVVVSAFFGTRLSLTFPLTLKRRAYAMSEGWALTKGRFWTLFATFLIIFVITVLLSLVNMIATEQEYLSAIARHGFTSPEAEQASMRQYQLLMAGTVNVQIIVNWLLAAVQNAIMCALSAGAAATAVQQLTADEAGLAETFS